MSRNFGLTNPSPNDAAADDREFAVWGWLALLAISLGVILGGLYLVLIA